VLRSWNFSFQAGIVLLIMTNYIQELRDVIRRLHGSEATHVESVPVKETFQGQTVWEGIVEVFDLKDHPTAHRAYAWAHDTDNPKNPRRHVAVLHAHQVKSAEDAVRAFIIQESRMAQQKKARKVGRPKLPKGEAKGRIVPVRFTRNDLKVMEAAARARNQTVSEWIRSTVMGRNIEIWYAFCPDKLHIPLFEIDSPPKQRDYCHGCGCDKELHGIDKGYVSHEERNNRLASSRPLSNPDSKPSPSRL